jgi:hypothetical protein
MGRVSPNIPINKGSFLLGKSPNKVGNKISRTKYTSQDNL